MRLFILCIILLFAETIYSQQITVLDSLTSSPLVNVNIISNDGRRAAVTDYQGKFLLSDFHKNDSLTFSHVSYSAKKLSYDDLLSQPIILLQPNIIPQNTVTVTDEKSNLSNAASKETVVFDEKLSSSFVNAGDALKTQTSIYIRDFGGFAGAKTVSARGMSSENTIILFNEARVNDLNTGLFDLSNIGTSTISKIEYNKSFDENTSYSSSGGVLKIFSNSEFKGRNANLGLRLSSDNYKSAFAEYNDGNENIFFNLNGERSYSQNDFNYVFEEKELKRQNAHFNKSFLGGNLAFNYEDFALNSYNSYTYLKSGIPGFVVTNNYNSSRALNTSHKYLSILNSNYKLNDETTISGIVSYNRQLLTLDDPEGFLVNYNKESNLSDFAAIVKARFTSGSFSVIGGNEFSASSLKNVASFISGNNTPDKIKRISDKLFTNLSYIFITPFSFINSISLFSKLNYEYTREDIGVIRKMDNTGYDFGLSIIPLTDFPVAFKAHYGKTYRFPTFNERYYASLYNHYELSTEKYKSFDAGIEGELKFLDGMAYSLSYFNIEGNNKIIWVPTRLALQTPRNIAKVKTYGLEFNLTQKVFNEILETGIYYVYTRAKNRSSISEDDLSYDKQLIYMPVHRLSMNLTADISPVTLSVYSSAISKSYYTSDNNTNYLLPGYFVVDASASYKFNLFERRHSFTVSAYNLFNEEYLIIQSYPMPLRSFLITLNMEIL